MHSVSAKAKAITDEEQRRLSFRRRMIRIAGSRTRNGRAMRLVDQILDPVDTDSAALALSRLIALLSKLPTEKSRIETHFCCLLQATFYFSDWKEILRLYLDAMKETHAARKQEGDDDDVRT
jgi:hypothetical protein